ncbi:hypothetical protein, partial [Escherichia coli]|uniref:hypothetical protein n=1 Tax=Escherichia coli TaxID=562 RepID=UPI003D056EEC
YFLENLIGVKSIEDLKDAQIEWAGKYFSPNKFKNVVSKDCLALIQSIVEHNSKKCATLKEIFDNKVFVWMQLSKIFCNNWEKYR